MRKKRMLGIYKLKKLIYIVTNVIIFNTKAKIIMKGRKTYGKIY